MRLCAGRPVILAVCDDAEDMRRIERELRTRYEADSRVVFEGSAGTGLQALQRLGEAGEEVALVLADQQMRKTSGVGVSDPRWGVPSHLTRKRGSLEGWPLERRPLLLETSMPGVFAVGDARDRSVKRVASAVGESSIAIQQVHEYLSQIRPRRRR